MMNKKQSNTHQLFLVALTEFVQHSIKELEIQCSIRFGLSTSAFQDIYDMKSLKLFADVMNAQDDIGQIEIFVNKNVKLRCNTI